MINLMNSKYPLEAVYWTDAYGCSTDWTPLDEVVPEPCTIECVGRIIHETDTHIVVAPHTQSGVHDKTEESVCGEMTIPKVCILERRVLTIGPAKGGK